MTRDHARTEIYLCVCVLTIVQARFTHDTDQIDTTIAAGVEEQLELMCRATAALALTTLLIPALVFPLVIAALLYSRIGNFYRKTSRELKRLDSTTKSPIFAQFSESLVGVTTIRAYGDAGRLAARNTALLEENMNAFYHVQAANRWLGLRVDRAIPPAS